MSILPIDSGRYGTKEMKDIFEEDRKLNYELIFESAVASAQAELSIIPKDAYKIIEEVVSSNKITVQRVKELESISERMEYHNGCKMEIRILLAVFSPRR